MVLIGLWWLCRLAARRLLLVLMLFAWLSDNRARGRRVAERMDVEHVVAANNTRAARGMRKPVWVADELIRMKAFCPELGCRKLAEAFNRRFAVSDGITVSKSHVGRVLKARQYEVMQLRRSIRHRIPRPMCKNVTWGLDLTNVTDAGKCQRLVLGIVDHGTRACIALNELTDKRSLTILREIIRAMQRFGLPQRIRVDNDACLKSKLMRFGLALLGVHLQVIAPFCPWQNGRIEQFFGTFKAAIRKVVVIGSKDLAVKLMEFRAYYNHARSHQHLNGRTPVEVWCGSSKGHGSGHIVEIWNGALSGWYFPLRE